MSNDNATLRACREALAARLTALAIVHQEYAPTLLEAAEQLQRQAAVVEAADAAKHMLYLILCGMPPDHEHYRPAQVIHGVLENALAALEATDGR